MPPRKKKRFYVRDIDPKIWGRFRIIAIKNDLTLNELMLAIITQAVEFAEQQEQEREKTAGRR